MPDWWNGLAGPSPSQSDFLPMPRAGVVYAPPRVEAWRARTLPSTATEDMSFAGAVGGIVPNYQPGTRESSNVEDRRNPFGGLGGFARIARDEFDPQAQAMATMGRR